MAGTKKIVYVNNDNVNNIINNYNYNCDFIPVFETYKRKRYKY